MKKNGICLGLVLLGSFMILHSMTPLGCEAASGADKPVKLTMISAYTKDHVWNKYLFKWMEKVAENSKGRITIQWRGGPEVISPFQNLAPVSKGSFDFVSNTPAFYPTIMPEGTGMQLCFASPMEHRKLGTLQILDKVYRTKMNLTLLGWPFHGQGFGMLTFPPVKTLADLKGLKCRVVPQWVPVAKALGMAPVTLSIPETYSALEKKIANAVLFVLDPTLFENGWYEHLKYVIRPNLYYVTSDFIHMNVDSWNRLSKKDQGILVDSIKNLEPEIYDFFIQLTEKEIQRALSLGLKTVEFSKADAQEYVRLQFQTQWKEFEASAPDTAAKLKTILPVPKELMPK
ncbi:MAG: hypothetical protein A2170_16125 [Deltaproteobacteria bacterium RBG_13_53_10]|nr:MAG: hypothetical protein A2170_16125 [Deltaproteobacteria bacterium RBG_13_53_10]